MKRTRITISGTTIEVVIQPQGAYWKFWVVGNHLKTRSVLVHYMSSDDIETRLCYNLPGDIIWEKVTSSVLPEACHPNGKDYLEHDGRPRLLGPKQNCAMHIAFWALADKMDECCESLHLLPGRWGNQNVVFDLNKDGSVNVSEVGGSTADYPFIRWHKVNGFDRWVAGNWQLHLMNSRNNWGNRFSIYRLDEDELHLPGMNDDQIAEVYHRVHTQG